MIFDDIENAIIEEVKTGMTDVKTVESYAGQMELADDIEKLPITFPAVFVSLVEMPLDRLDNIAFNEQPEFALLLCYKDARAHSRTILLPVPGWIKLSSAE